MNRVTRRTQDDSGTRSPTGSRANRRSLLSSDDAADHGAADCRHTNLLGVTRCRGRRGAREPRVDWIVNAFDNKRVEMEGEAGSSFDFARPIRPRYHATQNTALRNYRKAVDD